MTGSTSHDVSVMFSGDNVVAHMSNLFDGHCQTRSISADEQVRSMYEHVHTYTHTHTQAALASSADGAFSGNAQFTDTVSLVY